MNKQDMHNANNPACTVGFAVIYRWKLRSGMEHKFQDAWRIITKLISEERGGLGSRLHKTSDCEWVAYAQWPSKDAWQQSRALGSVDAAASEEMSSAIEQSFDPVLLYPVDDLLIH